MSQPLVSIVTPSFNSLPYIDETIKSVIDQHYFNIEHIVIDGGSTDGTVEILKANKHIIWISEKDNGQSQAINIGFKKANGTIIGWLNADDTYNPGTIETAVQFFIDNPNIDLLYTDVNIINEKGKVIGISRGDNFDLQRILTFNMVKQPSLFMRRKVVDDLTGLNEELHYVMDQEFWLRAGMNNLKFYYLSNAIFANFRLIPGTKSFESATSFCIEWQEVVEKYLNHPVFGFIDSMSKKKILSHSIARIYIAKMVSAVVDKNRFLVFSNFYKSVRISPELLTNMGMWKFLILGLLGKQNDRLLKFQ